MNLNLTLVRMTLVNLVEEFKLSNKIKNPFEKASISVE